MIRILDRVGDIFYRDRQFPPGLGPVAGRPAGARFGYTECGRTPGYPRGHDQIHLVKQFS